MSNAKERYRISSFSEKLKKKERKAHCSVTYCAGHLTWRAQLAGKDDTDTLSKQQTGYMSFLFSILRMDPSFLYPQAML